MFDVPPPPVNKSIPEPPLRSMSQTPAAEKRRNYRFYAGDPAIHPAEKRLYANGDFEGTPLHVSGCPDPRDITRSDRSYHDLPVPKFKLDRCWVGVIPAKEVTFRNLNDNITKPFLTDMCKHFGDIEDCKIYFDRHTKKHLGLGTVIFKTTKSARECVHALNSTTKMGNVISASLETSGQERMKQYATLNRAQEQEKVAQEKALAASAAASPPPSTDSNIHRLPERGHKSTQGSTNHRVVNHVSAPHSTQDPYRTSKHQPPAVRYDSRTHHSSKDTTDQFSFDPYGSFGSNNNNNSNNNYKSSRRSHHRSHRPSSQPKRDQRRRRRRSSSSSTSSSTSRSSSSSSSTSTSSTSSSTSKSDSTTSSSSRSSASSKRSTNHKRSNDSRSAHSKQPIDDETQRPSLDERIAALFQQQQQTSLPSSMPSKPYHRPLPLPNVPPPSLFSFPPPPLPSPLAHVVGSHHHHHQQSYGVVNNFNFFGNSFPPASFLNSTGGTNWQDMFKQPPPSPASGAAATTSKGNPQSYHSSNGLQPHPTDASEERERKTHDLTTAVTNIVTGELVEILRKDLAKKLIETLVYKSIETWYDNEERKEKIRKIKSAEQATIVEPPPPSTHEQSIQLNHSVSHPVFERIPDEIPTPVTAPVLTSSSTTNFSTYFEHMKDSTGLTARSQMPKIPSFKKRAVPEEKALVTPSKDAASSVEKKSAQRRKTARKRLSSGSRSSRSSSRSSSSRSSISSDTDESRSRDSAQAPHEDLLLPEVKTDPKTTRQREPMTPDEEEGEIKDDDDNNGTEKDPTPPPIEPLRAPSPPVKKLPEKKTVKPIKKPVPGKKRKKDVAKSDSTQELDDLDNSTLAKRKKSANIVPPSFTHIEETKLMQTFNLLESLPAPSVPARPVPDPFAYIQYEHNYAIFAQQPVPVAKRLTADGLHHMGVLAPTILAPTPTFPPREHDADMRIMYEIDQGIDEEDMTYLKQSFQSLCDEGHSCTTKTRWVDHPASRDLPFVKHPVPKHRTGCARTEGYYKVIKEEKISPVKPSDASQSVSMLPQAMLDTTRTTGAQNSRELRSEHRRNLLALGDVEFADHFKFSQLKLRKKRLRYAKSSIHSWGLFACEPIAMEDMVIEYVGETVRQTVGDLREKQYELEGINSNYMFRVDSDTIVDATKCGNLARFINHSCDPNCYAKIIPVESQKKIVIYSKRDIRLGEEITYDYKFPLEEQKIPCRCGTPACRGSLN